MKRKEQEHWTFFFARECKILVIYFMFYLYVFVLCVNIVGHVYLSIYISLYLSFWNSHCLIIDLFPPSRLGDNPEWCTVSNMADISEELCTDWRLRVHLGQGMGLYAALRTDGTGGGTAQEASRWGNTLYHMFIIIVVWFCWRFTVDRNFFLST